MARVQLHKFEDRSAGRQRPAEPGGLRPARLPCRGGHRGGRDRHVGRGHGAELRAGRDRALSRPGHRGARQAVPGEARQHADPAALHRHALGRRAAPGAAPAAIWCGATSRNDENLRWLEEDDHVGRRFRASRRNSNGNTFDYEGRQIAFCHGTASVIRYERDGTVTVLADRVRGRALQRAQRRRGAPDDGAIWFTDPGYGGADELRGQALRAPPRRSRSARKRSTGSTRSGKVDQGRGRAFQAQRHLLQRRLQEALRRRHRPVALCGQAPKIGDLGVRRRRRAAAQGRAASPTCRDGRQDRLRRRHPRRRGRQHLGRQPAGSATAMTASTCSRPTACASARSACRRSAPTSASAARKRNRLFMTGEPVALRGACRDPRRPPDLKRGRRAGGRGSGAPAAPLAPVGGGSGHCRAARTGPRAAAISAMAGVGPRCRRPGPRASPPRARPWCRSSRR